MKNLTKVFSFVDLYKYKFFFRVGDSIENSTIFSIFISLFTLTPLIVYFIIIAISTLNHSSPQINIQEYDVNSRPFLSLNTGNFRLAFRIIAANMSDFNGKFDEYFDISLFGFKANPVNGIYSVTEYKEFGLEVCNRSKFEDFPDYYEKNLQKAFCLKDHSFTIGGFWDENRTDWLDLKLSFCNTTQKKAKCKDREEIKRELVESYLYVYIESQDVDANNYATPLKRSMKSYFKILDFVSRKEMQFYMQSVELRTFDNLIYNVDSKKQFFNRQLNMDYDNIINKNDSTFARFQIFSSNKVQIIQRTYMTIIQAAAIVGGISSFIIILGTFITFKYNDMKLKVKLLNKLYQFEEMSSEKQPNRQENEKEEKINLFYNKKNGFNVQKISNIIKNNMKSNISEREITEENPKPNIDLEQRNLNYHEKHKKYFEIQANDAQNEKKGEVNKNLVKNEIIAPNLIEALSTPNNMQENKEKLNIEMNNRIAIKINENTRKTNEKNHEFGEKKQKLKFSTWETIFCIILPCAMPKKLKKKYALFTNASNYLIKYINIFYMVKILENVQKLKSILMNNHQITLFNYISKPKISLDRCNSQENYLSFVEKIHKKEKNNKEIMQEIQKYYNELQNNRSWNLMDIKLFDYLDEDIKRKLKCDELL